MTPFTLTSLIALGPVPRRYVRDVEDLLRLATDDDLMLLETGAYEIIDVDAPLGHG
jgi:hypothetical protein